MCRMASPWKHPKTGIYHIRIGVPARLRAVLPQPWTGKREYKRPLVDPETGERARSERDAKRLWSQFYEHWETMKLAAEAEVGGTAFKLSDKQIDALCVDWLSAQLAEYGDDVPEELERDVALQTFTDFLDVNRNREKPSDDALRRYLDKNSYIADEAWGLLETHSIPLPRNSSSFLRLCESLAWTGTRLVRSLNAHALGDWSAPEELQNAPTFELSSRGTGETIRKVYETYRDQRSLNERQRMEYENPVSALIELVGDLPINRVTASHVRAYRDQLIGSGLSGATVNGRLSVLRRLFEYAEGSALIAENPAAKIRVPRSQKKSKPRKPWTSEEMQRLLKGPVHAKGERPIAGRGEAAFWLPLLGIFTGARLEDLAQLRVSDVQVGRGGVSFIDVNGENGKQIKNDSAPRQIPVHQQLLEWGFLDFVKQQEEEGGRKLFPEVEPYRGQQAKAWGQWFGRYKRETIGINPTDSLKDFHSFRHGFADAARRAGIEETNRYRLLGHKHPLVGEAYGGEDLLQLLKKEIDRIEFEDLDLSPVRSNFGG